MMTAGFWSFVDVSNSASKKHIKKSHNNPNDCYLKVSPLDSNSNTYKY